MDVIVRSNNDPVNDITTPVSGLINDLDKVMKTKILRVDKVCLVSDCSGLSKWIFMSPTRQTKSGRLFMLSRRSGSCSVNIVNKIVSSVWWRAVQTGKNVMCYAVE